MAITRSNTSASGVTSAARKKVQTDKAKLRANTESKASQKKVGKGRYKK